MANQNDNKTTDEIFQTKPDTNGTDLQEQLIANEENYIANILFKCLKLCPSSFGILMRIIIFDRNLIGFWLLDKQPSKAEIIKWVNRGTRSLWTQVGSTLEHVVLWWSNAPLACRPAACAKYLRDWLLLIQAEGLDYIPFAKINNLLNQMILRCTRTNSVHAKRIGRNLNRLCNQHYLG